jgi:hypothetical protein
MIGSGQIDIAFAFHQESLRVAQSDKALVLVDGAVRLDLDLVYMQCGVWSWRLRTSLGWACKHSSSASTTPG